jgi:hypothetical protein
MMLRLSVTILSLFIFMPTALFGQTRIEGHIYDKHHQPILGANIFLEGTFNGTSSDAEGAFTFKADELGEYILIASL